MIDALLIANRGEIACRIIRTCQRLGIRSIAVYSDADRHALHVQLADEAVCIGPAPAAQSYLNADAIIEAALATNAGAIHPGYGFLSEKPELPELCSRHGIIWAGPRADIIRRMGSKMESKRIAEQAGVACVPGYHGDEQDPDLLYAEAVRIGFPVLIKASAGGGGRGMRRVDIPSDFHLQLEHAKQEARQAFGDDRVLIEKLITRPRHLEVQLLGDQHGNLIHLYERECSIQRNYQKIIEEAPAAWLPEETREVLLDSALRLGRAIQYNSVGTVEFVLDADTNTPYFMEMNTRLQVEHTVTELVTGLDLVELQLHSAAGLELPIKQHEISVKGWAIEARVNAEDPAQGYQPQIGTIADYIEPDLPGVRIDSGVRARSAISPYYDSMIAKVMGTGRTREQAALRLRNALDRFHLAGIGTNQAMLHHILMLPGFLNAPLTTHFMLENFPGGWQIPADLGRVASATAAWLSVFPDARAPGPCATPWAAADGFRLMARHRNAGAAALHVNNQRDPAENIRISGRDGIAQVTFENNSSYALTIRKVGDHLVQVEGATNDPLIFTVAGTPDAPVIGWRGVIWPVTVTPALSVMARASSSGAAAGGTVSSPMPGVITEVNVEVGQTVTARDVLLVMEAMKLIHPLEADTDGIVKAIHCSAGDAVGMGIPLVEIEAM